MKTEYIKQKEMEHLLAALMPENRLCCEISLYTGLRLSDVLNLRTAQVRANNGRFTVTELKTGKNRRVYLPVELQERAVAFAGKVYVFPHRCDYLRPRTRQAVFKDLKRVAKIFRLKPNIAPHSCRKVYAVEQYRKNGGNLQRVQKLLNHDSEAVTVLYALADELTERSKKGKK